MLPQLDHVLETPVYNAQALCIPLIDGMTMPANTGVDSVVTNGTVIYLHTTSDTGPNYAGIQQQTMLPNMSSNGFSYGGQVAMFSAESMMKKVLEGYVDTPCVEGLGGWYLPTPIDTNGVRYNYLEVLMMMLDGRANASNGVWHRVDPLWYRDPYGRIFNAPRLLDLSGTYFEGVPQRANISITLRLN